MVRRAARSFCQLRSCDGVGVLSAQRVRAYLVVSGEESALGWVYSRGFVVCKVAGRCGAVLALPSLSQLFARSHRHERQPLGSRRLLSGCETRRCALVVQ